MKSILKNAAISPRKAHLVARLVIGMGAEKALEVLKFTPKKGAQILAKVLASGIANAQNNQAMAANSLVISAIHVSEGLKLRRSVPHSRGRARPIRFRYSHITISLTQDETLIAKIQKKAEKEQVKSAKTTKLVAKTTTTKNIKNNKS